MAMRAYTIDRLKAHSMTTHAVRVVVMSMDAAPPGAECVAIDDVRPLSSTHLRAPETAAYLVGRLLVE